MGLFDFLKNNKDEPNNTPVDNQLQSDIERFEKEFYSAVQRYISTPGAEVNIKARHEVTNEVIPFAIGFPEQFNPWRTTRSLADRRGIIYSLLDTQFGNQLELWQAIERFNDDRYVERALQIAIDHKDESNDQNPNYWNALARTNFILTKYEDAEQNCLKAIALDKDNIRTKRIYADILHCSHRGEKAHEIYDEILELRIPKDTTMTLPIQQLLGFDGDIVNSPIYAASWLKTDKTINEATWEWANEEFYYSPHFRSQYAYRLIENNEHLKGFVKLLSLTKEMPWFKEAVINSHNLIDQLNLQDSMNEEKIRLSQLITKNNWN